MTLLIKNLSKLETAHGWRKVSDALVALGRIDEAKVKYQKGSNEAGRDYKALGNGSDRDRLNEWRVSTSSFVPAMSPLPKDFGRLRTKS